MDIATHIYNDIIKEKGVAFRGISLGDDMEEVVKIEGDDYDEVHGSLPHYEYFFETGEWEEVTIYYGFKEKENTVNSITLYLYGYPKIYWKDSEGTNEVDFFNRTQQGNLDEYSKHFNGAKNKIIESFEKQFGEPILLETDEVFNQPYHKFKKRIWKVENGISLSTTEYIDDFHDNSTKNHLCICLEKDQ